MALRNDTKDKDELSKESSGYAMTSHSGDLIEEDIYVSDGSDDEDALTMTMTMTQEYAPSKDGRTGTIET